MNSHSSPSLWSTEHQASGLSKAVLEGTLEGTSTIRREAREA